MNAAQMAKRRRDQKRSGREADPPGLPGWLGLSAVRRLETDPLEFMQEVRERFGDVASMRIMGTRVVLVSHPDGVRQVLQDNHTIFTKQNSDYRLLARVLGQGLVTSDGEFWRRQRRMIQPAFHKEKVRGFGTLMSKEASASAERLRAAARAGETIDMVDLAQDAALTIVLQTLFGLQDSKDSERIAEIFSKLNAVLSAQFSTLSGRFAWMPTKGNRALAEGKKAMDLLVDSLIDARRDKGDGDDLLGMLLGLRDEESGLGMSNEQLRDEVTTMLVAGYETTAMALSWAVYLLGRNPEAADRLREEARRVLGDRAATLADFEELEFTRRVLEESLRLYPSAWAVSRTPNKDTEVGGYRVAAGSLVFISPWLTQRHPEFWEDPERFDPDRFAPETSAARPRFAHFPFLGGPRMCIGHAFASMEARILLATWMATVRLPLASDLPVTADPLVTLRPKGGVLVRPQPLTA